MLSGDPCPLSKLGMLMTCRRQAQVKAAMQHAWSNYVKYAFGHDELMPRSLRGKDPFGGLGATILDSLDTLWLMGMQEEYQQARDWVANDLNFTRCKFYLTSYLHLFPTKLKLQLSLGNNINEVRLQSLVPNCICPQRVSLHQLSSFNLVLPVLISRPLCTVVNPCI